MQDFGYWQDAACKAVGSEAALAKRLPTVLTPAQLARKTDSALLSLMSLRVFQSGLQHKMVAQKWPRFEQVYFGFDPQKLVRLSDEQLEQMMMQDGLIKHWRKTQSIRSNAAMIIDKADSHGSFGRWLSKWPPSNAISLWRLLKKEGAQLGGHSGPRFLRMAGYDTFLLTDDVLVALKAHGVIDRAPTTIKELDRLQALFTHWSEQGSCPQAHVSRMISLLAPISGRH